MNNLEGLMLASLMFLFMGIMLILTHGWIYGIEAWIVGIFNIMLFCLIFGYGLYSKIKSRREIK